MSPLQMIAEWRRGCSNAPEGHPESCHVCTAALIDALQRRLTTMPTAEDLVGTGLAPSDFEGR
jgi:hypothetical protein